MALTSLWLDARQLTLQPGDDTGTLNVHDAADDATHHVRAEVISLDHEAGTLLFNVDGTHHKAHIRRHAAHDGRRCMIVYLYNLQREVTLWLDPPAQPEATSPDNFTHTIVSPLTGKVCSLHVKPGQQIKKGDLLLVIESMKMENELRAPADAIVQTVSIGCDVLVESGQLLITLDKPD